MKALSMKEAVERLGCGKTFLYDAAKRQEIPVIRYGDRVLIDEDDLPAIIAHYKIPARVKA